MLGVLGAMAALDRPHLDAFEIAPAGHRPRRRAGPLAGRRPGRAARELRRRRPVRRRARRASPPCTRPGAGCVIAGNQPPQARAALEAMDLGVDAILISDELGAQKPTAAFFDAVVDMPLASRRERIAYVGDRLDNDVLPARRAGMRTVLLKRGPWGYLHAERPDAALADVVTDSLAELVRHCSDVRSAIRTGGVSGSVVTSTARATRSTVSSRQRRPTTCRPIGRPACSGRGVLAARHRHRRARRHEVEHGGHVGGVVARRRPRAGPRRRRPSPPATAGWPSSGRAGRRGRRGSAPGAATGSVRWISMRLRSTAERRVAGLDQARRPRGP